MRNAIIGVIAFVLFIALVEWQRRTAILPKGFDAKVASNSGSSVRRDAVRLYGSKGSAADRSGAAGPTVTGGDAGAAGESARPSPPEKPEDPEVARKKAEAVMVAIERLLDGEDREEPWATEIESWVRNEYGQSVGSHLERVACKETLCIVVVLHDSDVAYHTWLSRLVTDEKHLRAMTMPGPPEAGKTRSKTYLFRESVGKSSHDGKRASG